MSDFVNGLLADLSWFWAPHALYGAVKGPIAGRRLKAQNASLELAAQSNDRSRVALIIPVKGAPDNFDRFLDLALHQEYDNYRIVFVTQSEDDPARLAILSRIEQVGDGAPPVTTVVAGLAEDEGQKVHNQLAALRLLEPKDQIIAFADADIVGSRDWLRKLVTPLNAGMADCTTGYRWFIPQTQNLACLLATNLNGGVAMLAGPRWSTLLWGGSMALTRETFDELDLRSLLRGSLNDDLQISMAARMAGKRLLYVRSLLAPTPVSYTWASLFEFGRRQYFQVRVYAPIFWWLGLFLTSLYLAGAGATVIRIGTGDHWGWLPLLVVIGLNLVKCVTRGKFLRSVFPTEICEQIRPAQKLEWFTTSLNFIPHWLIIVSSALTSEISWAGIRYRVFGPQDVKVLSRDGTPVDQSDSASR